MAAAAAFPARPGAWVAMAVRAAVVTPAASSADCVRRYLARGVKGGLGRRRYANVLCLRTHV